KTLPVSTVEERRAAIKGWVFSPYRMHDLMAGILGLWDNTQHERVRLRIYDDNPNANSLLYDSQRNHEGEYEGIAPLVILKPVEFNGKKWLLEFTRDHEFAFFHVNIFIVFISGVI